MRVRGVFSYNLPPQVGTTVRPADFGVAGAIGRFARGLTSLVDANNIPELAIKTGGYKSGYYGRYVLDKFFQNLKGSSAKLWIKMFVASDAVQASRTIQDPSPANTLKVKAAYRQITDKSLDGNQSGYTLTNGARVTTTAGANASLSATALVLTSVSQIAVGDLLKIVSTGPVTHYTKVSAVDENTKTVTCTALTNAVTAADVVTAMGFQIVCYRKDNKGAVSKVDVPENSIWLSLEPENTQYYVNTAFANHPYLDLEDLASATSGPQNTWPADVSTVTFLTSGSDGTAPASTSDWNLYSAFDSKNIRFLFNTDTTLSGVNLAGEAYCTGRLDTPIWIYNIPSQQTKDQLKTIGLSYQRSNQVQGVINASWRNVVDPIGVGANPVLRVPTVGAYVGAWIWTALTGLGIHQIAAGDDVPLIGFEATPDATEDAFTEQERTEILETGVNLIQFIPGIGLSARSGRTPSTNVGALFANYLLMQNFIKVSSVESLHRTESRPNRITALQEYGRAIQDFGRKLYEGSFPFGIDSEGAFGQFFLANGDVSGFDDVFVVQADQFNNPNSSINNGEGNIFVRFFPPAPLESLAIGVGVLIPL
jgi:hypothetical protein